MPFDKISPQQLFLMRIVTALTFLALGAGLMLLELTTRPPPKVAPCCRPSPWGARPSRCSSW